MKKLFGAVAVLLFLVGSFTSGCGSSVVTPEGVSNLAEADRVQVVLAMGNPEYGADSKMIEDADELEAMVEAFRGANVGEGVADVDLAVSDVSRYIFLSGDTVLAEFAFNGNDTERIWMRGGFRYIVYPGDSPYNLYRESKAEVFVVDEDLNEMTRPD